MLLGSSFFRIANHIEAGLWFTIAAIFAVRAMVRSSRRKETLIAVIALAIFGLSDLIEAGTGAWWLLGMKAGCVGVLLGLLIRHIARRNLGVRSNEMEELKPDHRSDSGSRSGRTLS